MRAAPRAQSSKTGATSPSKHFEQAPAQYRNRPSRCHWEHAARDTLASAARSSGAHRESAVPTHRGGVPSSSTISLSSTQRKSAMYFPIGTCRRNFRPSKRDPRRARHRIVSAEVMRFRSVRANGNVDTVGRRSMMYADAGRYFRQGERLPRRPHPALRATFSRARHYCPGKIIHKPAPIVPGGVWILPRTH